MIRIQKIAAYLRDAEASGVDIAGILSASGITPEMLQAPGSLLTPTQLRTALLELAKQTPPGFALAHGARTRQLDMGLLGHAVLSCQNIQQIINIWVNYGEVIGHPLNFISRVEGDWWIFDITPKVILPEIALCFLVEEAIASYLPLLTEVADIDVHDVRFEVTFSPPDHQESYRKWVPAPVKFGSEFNRIITHKKYLSIPVKTAGDAEVLAMFDKHCSTILQHIHTTDSYAQQVKELLLLSRGRVPLIGGVANRLGISKRTLNRRLAEEGYTFQQIVNDYRRDYAFELLKEGMLQPKEIAHVLGFSNVSSFRRVFREWTGLTISGWLASQRGV